jgi:Cellulose biosynthesis protein BcsS
VRGTFDMGLYAGVDFVNHRISPNDPFNPVSGNETGFKVALDIESHRHLGLPYYYSLEGAYSTAFDTYFLMGRLGVNRSAHIFGVEGWLLGDETGDAQRLGAFVSFDRQLRPDLLAEVSFSAGYQFVDDADRLCSSFFGSEGAYGTLNISFHFGGAAPARPMK